MADYVVTTRNADGSLIDRAYTANDRADLFKKLAADGLSAVRVREGALGKKPRRAKSGGAPSKGRGLIAAAIVVVCAILVFFCFQSEKVVEVEKDPTPKSLPSPKNEVKKTAPVEKSQPRKKFKDLSNDEKLKYYRDKYGDNIPDNLKSVVYFLENPPKKNFRPSPRPYSIFKRRSEREIAAMLLVEPGDWMLRAPTFDERFDNDFSEALKEKIEFSKDDTEDQRMLKQAVIETKAEIASRIRAGEKASEIMNAAAADLYELGKYRRELEEQVSQVSRDETYSDQDVMDFVTAANEILKKKGARPIKVPNMVIRHASLKIRSEKARKNKNEGMGK